MTTKFRKTTKTSMKFKTNCKKIYCCRKFEFWNNDNKFYIIIKVVTPTGPQICENLDGKWPNGCK